MIKNMQICYQNYNRMVQENKKGERYRNKMGLAKNKNRFHTIRYSKQKTKKRKDNLKTMEIQLELEEKVLQNLP